MQTTDTGLVRMAQRRKQAPEQAQAALRQLGEQCVPLVMRCAARWRTFGDPDDFAQGFFVDFLARGIDSYDPRRGRFRSWLWGKVRNYVRRKLRYDRADKRDARKNVSFEEGAEHAAHALRHTFTPERTYESALALRAIDDALEATRQRYAARGQAERFALLESFIPGDELASLSYEAVAAALHMNDAGTARKAVFDLRERYRKELRDRIEDTTGPEQSIDDRLEALIVDVQLPEPAP